MSANPTLETRMTVLETEFRTELGHLATKKDLADLKADLLKWIITLMSASVLASVSSVLYQVFSG